MFRVLSYNYFYLFIFSLWFNNLILHYTDTYIVLDTQQNFCVIKIVRVILQMNKQITGIITTGHTADMGMALKLSLICLQNMFFPAKKLNIKWIKILTPALWR